MLIDLIELVLAIIGLASLSKWFYDHRNDGSALSKLSRYLPRF